MLDHLWPLAAATYSFSAPVVFPRGDSWQTLHMYEGGRCSWRCCQGTLCQNVPVDCAKA